MAMDSPRTPEPRTTTSGFLDDEEGMLIERRVSGDLEASSSALCGGRCDAILSYDVSNSITSNDQVRPPRVKTCNTYIHIYLHLSLLLL